MGHNVDTNLSTWLTLSKLFYTHENWQQKQKDKSISKHGLKEVEGMEVYPAESKQRKNHPCLSNQGLCSTRIWENLFKLSAQDYEMISLYQLIMKQHQVLKML